MSRLSKGLLLLLMAVFVVFLYTFLHEGGHALVGLLSGGTITTFDVSFWNLDAHVAYTGSLTPAQLVLNNLAGAGLPLLVWLIFILIVPKRANFALEGIKVIGTLTFLSTLLAWVYLPIRFLTGQLPSDDVTNFLNNSGVHPLWVTGTALLAFAGGWLLFSKKIDGLRREIDLFRTIEVEVITPAVRRTTLSVAGLMIVFALVTFGANGFTFTRPGRDPYQPPQGYTLVNKIVLSEAANDRSAVYSFTLDQPARVGIFLLVEAIDTEYIEIKLTGPNQYEHLILHGEGYLAHRDIPHMEELLQPGQYQCILTNKLSPGVVSIYSMVTP